MSSSKLVSSQYLVPLGSVITAIVTTVSVCGWAFNSRAALTAQVEDLDRRVSRAESRLDKGDDRWEQIRTDLSQIKERLGIVEASGGKK